MSLRIHLQYTISNRMKSWSTPNTSVKTKENGTSLCAPIRTSPPFIISINIIMDKTYSSPENKLSLINV